VILPAIAFAALVAIEAPSLPGEPVETEWGRIPAPQVLPRDAAERGPFGPSEALAPPLPPRPPLPDKLPFGPGESLRFSIDYGILNAGYATMEVAGMRRVSGRECMDIRTEAKSNAVFSKFYKVWDRAQTFLEPASLLPWRFEKHQREGGYEKDVIIKFDRPGAFARYENGDEVAMHPHAQDELSAFYYLRTLPLEVGRDVFVDNHTNRKNYPLRIIVHGREQVEVPAGTFDCWVIEPVMREGGIFTAKGTMTIWITADERRMPVKLRTKIVVGAVTASLTKFELAEPHPRPRDATPGGS
jgi:hypothetical protein